ncbi:hypothetical protein [Bradyrhizobium sp. CCBAU 21362]|uniref:hypothetical protein n=1 Tax=Bradyrhizobium sp. CCBAU 21362 TaxID=1325082 RepID=UPI0023056013|nr:hypothetical protein [Bradyrhizobium sp. CCBAU 21362]
MLWVATGDVELCTLAFRQVIERRSNPAAKFPSLAMWLMTYEGRATLYEAKPGAIYRKRIRRDWKPGDRGGVHPLETAMSDTSANLQTHMRSKRGRARETRRLARGKQDDGQTTWIPTRAWLKLTLFDHRKRGMILVAGDNPKAVRWSDIDVLAEPFKALGADRGRQTIAQRPDLLAVAKKSNERVQAKLAKHDELAGRAVRKPRGRPKASTNVRH